MIKQEELRRYNTARLYVEKHKASLKERMIAKESIEPGKINISIKAASKRVPDWQAYILNNHGAETIYQLKEEAVPTNYIEMSIKQGD